MYSGALPYIPLISLSQYMSDSPLCDISKKGNLRLNTRVCCLLYVYLDLVHVHSVPLPPTLSILFALKQNSIRETRLSIGILRVIFNASYSNLSKL